MNVNLIARKNTHQTTFYLMYTVGGRQVKEKTEFVFKNNDSAEIKKQTRLLADSYRVSRQTELNFSAAGIYDTGNLVRSFNRYCDALNKKWAAWDKYCMRYMLNHFRKFSGPDIYFKSITEDFCMRFRNHLKKTLKPESANKYFTVFKKILKSAARDKIIPQSPALYIKGIELSGPVIKKEVLDIKELHKLEKAECFRDDIKRAYLFAARTGMGTAELKALTVGQVDTKQMQVTYYRQKNKEKAIRPVTVPVSRSTLNLLGKLSSNKNEKIFQLPESKHIRRHLLTWMSNAGIDKHITPYCFRHSCAQILLEDGVPESAIIDIMGHSDYRMIRRYIRTDKIKKKAIKVFG